MKKITTITKKITTITIGAVLALTTPASAEISGDVVKLGVLNDMSGLYADNTGSGSVEAARMAIADFGGTVNGKKIELISADHQNKPDVGSAIATQWFDNDGVDAIVDVPTSSVALAVQDVAHNRNKVFLISGGAASDLTGTCSPPDRPNPPPLGDVETPVRVSRGQTSKVLGPREQFALGTALGHSCGR